MSYLIVQGGTTTLSISAFRDFISFSTRIESPGLLICKVTVISGCGRLLSLFDPRLYLRVPLEKVHCGPVAR